MMKTRMLLLAAFVAIAPRLADAAPMIDATEPDPGDPGGPETPPQPTFTKTLDHALCFPDCSYVNGRLAATPKAVTGTRDKLDGYGELDTYAKMNGHRYSLFRVRVAGVSEAKLRTDVTLTAYSFGAAIYSKPFVSTSGSYTWTMAGRTRSSIARSSPRRAIVELAGTRMSESPATLRPIVTHAAERDADAELRKRAKEFLS